ncbi:MAG: hypothetical protein ACHREM_05520 [Polyangiales bacterium]
MSMSTRVRFGVSCAAFACTAACVASFASCSTDNISSAGPDATTPDTAISEVDSAPADTAADTSIDTVIDAAPDVVDAAEAEAYVDAGCGPRSITGFVVPAYVHAHAQQYACLNHLPFNELAAACASDASTLGACTSFLEAGFPDPEAGPVTDACSACIVAPESTDGGYGPVVQGAVIVANVAGCIEIADNTEAGVSCAEAVQAAWRCTEYACSACPVTDNASQQGYLACANAAAIGVCATYTAAATSCIANERFDGGTTEAGTSVNQFCFAGTSASDQLSEIAAYFCLS